jgi:histidinol-phosphate aminotransferase
VPLDRGRGYALDEAGIERATADPRVKLVFFCTPNNPTGNGVDADVILRTAQRLADRALVVVDEAYAEFSPAASLIARIDDHPNVVVLRTLSKAYALAGARCGAVIAEPSIVELLRRMIPPYALPQPTIEAVLAALEEPRLMQARARIRTLVEERDRLAAALAHAPLVRRVWPSEANFVLAEATDAAALMAAGRRAGLLLRDFSSNPYTPGGVRISVGTPDQNDRLLRSLAAA